MTSTEPPALIPGRVPAQAPDRPHADLDDEQSAVVTLPADASGVVVGAPGSGKTFTVVERFRRLVDAGVHPDEILVLTPTRQTATALRDRLSLAAGRATSGAPARSVPSFAFQIVRAAEVTAGGAPPQLLTGGEEDQLLRELLEGDAEDDAAGASRGWPSWLGPDIRATAGFRTEVRTFLAECTTQGIEPATLADLPRLGAAILWAASRDEAMVVEHLVNIGRRSALVRTAHLLLELGLRLQLVGLGSDSGFACPLNQYHLADALGLTAIHVNRTLRQLRERGLVTFREGRVEFNDLAGLRTLAEYHSGYLDQNNAL